MMTAGSGGPPGDVIYPVHGDFCCCPIAGWGGRWIRLGQMLAGYLFTERKRALSKFCHSFLYMGRVDDTVVAGWPGGLVRARACGYTTPGCYCIEAMPGGARLRKLADTAGGVMRCYGGQALWSTGIPSLALSLSQRDAVCELAVRMLGTPYSLLDYVYLILAHLSIPAPHLRKFIADTGHDICSQLVDYVRSMGGNPLFENRWFGDVIPADLAALLESGSRKGM